MIGPLGLASVTFADLGYPWLPIGTPKVRRAAIREWFALVGHECPVCGERMWQPRAGVNLDIESRIESRAASLDHVLAQCLGGARDDGANIWVICARCNRVKMWGEVEAMGRTMRPGRADVAAGWAA